MKTHGARSQRHLRLGAILASVLTLIAIIAAGASAPAQAALLNQGTKVTVMDAASKGDCTFKVKSVAATTITGLLQANVRPRGLGGFNTNQHVAQYCWVAVLNNPGSPLAVKALDQDGPKASGSVVATIPRHSRYTICTQIQTVVEGGTTYTSTIACKNTPTIF